MTLRLIALFVFLALMGSRSVLAQDPPREPPEVGREGPRPTADPSAAEASTPGTSTPETPASETRAPETPVEEPPVQEAPADSAQPAPDDRRPIPFERTAAAQGGSTMGTLGTLSLLVGLGGLVGSAIGFGLREGHAESWNNDLCLEGGRTRAENCQPERDAALRAEAAAVGLLIGGGVLAVAGLLLLILASGDDADTPPETEASLRCRPSAGLLGASCAF